MGGAKRYKPRVDATFANAFGSLPQSGVVLSLVENGGAAGQDEAREADVHSLLCFSLQRSARKVLAWLSASWETAVSTIVYVCGDATVRNAGDKWRRRTGSSIKWQLLI